MNRFTGAGAAMALCLMAGSAMATELKYNQFDLRYWWADENSESGMGLGIRGLLTPDLYLVASYDDNGVRQTARYGGGYRYALHPSATDVFAEVVQGEVKLRGGFESVSGIGASVGLRHLFTPTLEVSGRVNYLNLDDDFGDDLSFFGDAAWHYSKYFSLVLSVTVEEETNAAGLGFRFSL